MSCEHGVVGPCLDCDLVRYHCAHTTFDDLAHTVFELKSEVATERAAREAAEKQFGQLEKQLELACASALRLGGERDTAMLRSNERYTQLKRAESERDAALREKQRLENEINACVRDFNAQVDRTRAAESALASARPLFERAVKALESLGWGMDQCQPATDIRAWLSSHPAAAPVAAPQWERKVLEACAALSSSSLEAFGKPASTPWVKFAHAELARRAAKGEKP